MARRLVLQPNSSAEKEAKDSPYLMMQAIDMCLHGFIQKQEKFG